MDEDSIGNTAETLVGIWSCHDPTVGDNEDTVQIRTVTWLAFH